MVSTSMVYGCIIDVFNTEDISAECFQNQARTRPAVTLLAVLGHRLLAGFLV